MTQQMHGMRTWRERAIQTVSYEIGGIILITPIFAQATDHALTESVILIVALSVMFLLWTFAHNLIFDMAERTCGGGPSSTRSHKRRIFHALSLEVSSVIVTLPVIMWSIGLSFWDALLVDVGLSFGYALYAYVFYLAFDRLLPVRLA